MNKTEPHSHWSGYLRDILLWLLLSLAGSGAIVAMILEGIHMVMDYFLRDDRFYHGVAASAGISACGTIILFLIIYHFVREIGRYPRKLREGQVES